jgi:predicted amidophosphoribosyltransferase
MSKGHQGDLANLWAVGGKQSEIIHAERERFFYRFCPQCGWQLTGKFSTCPRCSADLRIKVCPYCRGEIPANKGVCPRCSAPLE